MRIQIKHLNRIRIILWTAVVIWMAVIFSLSAQIAVKSVSLSGSTVKIVIENTQPGFRKLPVAEQNSIVENYQHLARKTAHMLAYLLLGILCTAALYQYPISKGERFVTPLTVCTAYACTDEVHQLFIAGRSGQITDVCIDACGAIIGICAVMLVHWIWHKSRKKIVMQIG